MKLRITDPCYIIDVEEWSKICEISGNMMGDWATAFDKLVTDYLVKKTGAPWAKAGSTWYGDWSNTMYGEAVTNSGNFVADSGMWCVVPAEFCERGDMNMITDGAILEFDDDGEIVVEEIENNKKQWAEIQVTGKINGLLGYAVSGSYGDDEE